MKSSASKLGQLTYRIDIQISPEEVQAMHQEVFANVQNLDASKASLVGQTHPTALEKTAGEQIRKNLPQALMQRHFPDALIEQKLTPVAPPHLQADPWIEGKEFHFWAQLEVKPVLEKIQVNGIKFANPEPKITPAMIKTEIDGILAQHNKWDEIPEGQGAKLGDTVMIDFQGFLNNQPVPKTFSQNQRIDLGSNVLIPGFEAGMVGMKKNENRDISLTIPNPYPEASLAGKTIVFKVHMKNLKKKISAVLNDEFVVKNFSQVPKGPKTVAEFQKWIQHELLERHKTMAFHQEKVGVLQQLINMNPFEVPNSLVQMQKNAIIAGEKHSANLKGLKTDHMNTPQYDLNVTVLATEMVRGALLIEAIAEHNQITVNDDDIETHLKSHAQKFGAPFEQVKAQFKTPQAKASIHYAVMEHKVMMFLLGKLAKKAS